MALQVEQRLTAHVSEVFPVEGDGPADCIRIIDETLGVVSVRTGVDRNAIVPVGKIVPAVLVERHRTCSMIRWACQDIRAGPPSRGLLTRVVQWRCGIA